jgi:sugar/nucleoside kinase (ribokinase family)
VTSVRTATSNVLLGPLSLDLYRDGTVLPGGGALNMAWHWRTLGVPFHFLTRIGSDYREIALGFLDRHGIGYSAASVVGEGASATIEIEILPDGQPHMDRFEDGVWADYRSTPGEKALIAQPGRLHVVLVEGAIAELGRLHGAGALADREVSADFLGFRHYTVERFADTMAAVDVAFIGWPGDREDPSLDGLRDVVHDLGRLLVVTLGSRGVQVFDGRSGGSDRWFDVNPVPVEGTTVGCGDAFIAWFLAEYWHTDDLAAAVERGKLGGAMATHWRHPLPDGAYGLDGEE